MNNLSITLSIISAIFLSACAKHDHVADHSETRITIRKPASEQVFSETDTIWPEVLFQNEDELHEYRIVVKNTTENKDVFVYNGHSHEQVALFSGASFLADVQQDSRLTLTAEAMDHNGTATSKSVSFTVKNTLAIRQPQVEITSPVSGMYNNKTTIALKGKVEHTTPLKQVLIVLQQDGTSIIVSKPSLPANTSSFVYDSTFAIDVATHADFSFMITATDVNDVSQSKTVSFHVHP